MKESSDSEPRRVAGESPQKKIAPRGHFFSLRALQGRVFLRAVRAPAVLRQALCVCKSFSLVSEDARCHIPALPAWGNKSGCSTNGLSTNQRKLNEQDTFILHSTKSPSYI